MKHARRASHALAPGRGRTLAGSSAEPADGRSRSRRRRAIEALEAAALVWVFLLGAPSEGSACTIDSSLPTRDVTYEGFSASLSNPCVHTFSIDGAEKRIIVYATGLPAADVDPRDGINDWLADTAEWAAEDWRKYVGFGFQPPKRLGSDGDVEETEIVLVPGSGGVTLGGGEYVIVGIDTLPAKPLEFRHTLAHELFHMVQYRSDAMVDIGELREGTADLVPGLLYTDIDEQNFGCAKLYLAHPDQTMWERPSPGRDESSFCHPVVWWKYFTEQLGTVTREPERGIDALVDLFGALSTDDGWRLQRTDRIEGVGKFGGDWRDVGVFRSATHLGFLRLVRSDPATLEVVAVGSRFGGQWRLQRSDEVQGIGDFNGDGRSDLILRSAGYLGIVGLDASGNRTTLAAVANDGRFGGQWRLGRSDEVQGVGDFNGDGRSDFILRSAGYLGIVGLDDSGRPTTLAVVANDGRFGGGWRLQRKDEVQGLGDFNGDGRSDFILRSSGYLGIIGLSASGSPTTLAVIANGGRFGGQWRLRQKDEVQGVGDFNGDGHSDLILRSASHLGIVGLDTSGRTATWAAVANGSRFGGQWRLQRNDEVQGIGDFNGDGHSDLILRSDSHLGIVGLDDSGRPATLAAVANDGRFGGQWRLRRDDTVEGVGDFNGDGREDIVLKSANLLAVVGLDTSGATATKFARENGAWFPGFLQQLDRFIRGRTGGRRNLDSLWRDFTVANYLKDLSGPLVTSVYLYDDEKQPPGSMGSVAKQEVTRGTSGRSAQLRWSAKYYHLPAVSRARRIAVTFTQDDPGNQASFTLAVAERGRLINKLDRSGSLREVVSLRRRQEIVVVVTTYATNTAYQYQFATR